MPRGMFTAETCGNRMTRWRSPRLAQFCGGMTGAGGFVVEHIYLHDPDLPNQTPPLARPDSMVREGEAKDRWRQNLGR